MKRQTLGALLLMAIIPLVGWFLVRVLFPKLNEREQLRTSDAQGRISETIRFAGDNYLGYWFINSPEIKRILAREGIQANFTDDGGAYADRLEKFSKKEYDIIVLPVKEYMDHGEKFKYPGVISVALSESKDADAIVAFGDKLPSGKLTDLNNSNLKIIYTGQSPSSFLLDLTITDFDLFNLRDNKNWRVEVNSSEEVYKKAKNHEGDVFVLWEPDVSKALQIPGMKYVWGSGKFSGYIIDVFVIRRDYFQSHHDTLVKFFQSYFRTMAIYSNNRDRLIDEMTKSTKLSKDTVKNMLPKIDWFDLYENAHLQFGLPNASNAPGKDGLIDTIIQCAEVMRRSGNKKISSLDPYIITNRSLVEELSKNTSQSIFTEDNAKIEFTPLSSEDWKKLREIGTMRVEPINFDTGSSMLTDEGKDQVDKIAKMLINNYPTYRVAIRGHTGHGDEAENLKLSEERAKTVMQRLIGVHYIDPNRLRAEGWGSKSPPQLRPDESPRALLYRMARVEFVLLDSNGI